LTSMDFMAAAVWGGESDGFASAGYFDLDFEP
jgi:hypothetical protein